MSITLPIGTYKLNKDKIPTGITNAYAYGNILITTYSPVTDTTFMTPIIGGGR